MKSYCKWNNKLELNYDYDGLIININTTNLDKLEEFAKNHHKQSIVAVVGEDDVPIKEGCEIILPTINKLYQQGRTNLRVRIPRDWFYIPSILSSIEELQVPYGVDEIVYGFDDLWMVLGWGVSEVKVGGYLGFKLKEVKKICGKKVNVVVHPNLATGNPNSGLPQFFIRPEYMMSYDRYVDVCEFYYFPIEDERWRMTDPNILYKIWFMDGKWMDDLRHIIIGLKGDYYNPGISPLFDERRLKCGRKCGEQPLDYKGRCDICKVCESLSQTYKQNNLIYQPPINGVDANDYGRNGTWV